MKRFCIILILVVSFQSFGATILWDVSKAGDYGYVPDRWFSDLRDHLSSSGFEMYSTHGGFLTDNPNDYDIAVVCAGSATKGVYSDAEVAEIQNFVNNGGGLLILSDSYPSDKHVRPVASSFGIEVGVSEVGTYPHAIFTSDFADHSIFDGVDEICFQSAGELSVSSHLEEFVWDERNGKTLGVIGNWGQGRVVALGDINIFSTFNTSGFYYDRVDNRQFSVNTFEYLAVPEPCTISLLCLGLLTVRTKKQQ